ncbi:hypothetical protein, partial [Eubacterium sp.]|uniref:hypothetical protein n=1 Tax=Eubacterium sp. TaxID=142586 RepID=UPI0026E1100E
AYERYLQILSQAITEEGEKQNWESVRWLSGRALAIPKRLNVVARQTDALAYKIDDQPELVLAPEYQIYLEKLEQAVGK